MTDTKQLIWEAEGLLLSAMEDFYVPHWESCPQACDMAQHLEEGCPFETTRLGIKAWLDRARQYLEEEK